MIGKTFDSDAKGRNACVQTKSARIDVYKQQCWFSMVRNLCESVFLAGMMEVMAMVVMMAV